MRRRCEASQLGPARQERGGGNGADALDGAQAGGGLRQGYAGRPAVGHPALDHQEVGLEPAQVTGDGPAQIGGRGLSQTVGVGPGHRHEVLPARQPRRQTLSLGVGGRAGREGQRPPHLGQPAGVPPVGLGQPTGGASNVAGLPGMDHTNGDAGAGQSVKTGPLVAARRVQRTGTRSAWPLDSRWLSIQLLATSTPMTSTHQVGCARSMTPVLDLRGRTGDTAAPQATGQVQHGSADEPQATARAHAQGRGGVPSAPLHIAHRQETRAAGAGG